MPATQRAWRGSRRKTYVHFDSPARMHLASGPQAVVSTGQYTPHLPQLVSHGRSQ